MHNLENQLLEAALDYSEKGWRVFPLTAKSKVPMAGTKGLHEATTDPATIVEWWTKHPNANIGLRGGGGLCIVDADVKNGKDGLRSLEAMEVDTDTLSVCTPSGGRHFYYRTGENFVNSQDALSGVDIRSEGAYVLAPPSIIDGREYEWLDEGLSEIADLPHVLSTLFKTFDCKDKDAPDDYVMDIAPPTKEEFDGLVALFTEYLKTKAKPAVEGESGHSSLLFASIKGVHGYRLDRATVCRLLWEYYNPRCSPEWDYDNQRDRFEFERKVLEAQKLTPKRIVCELTKMRSKNVFLEVKNRIHYYVSKKGQGTYFFRRDDGNYQPMNESTIRRHLKRYGLSDEKQDGDTESEIGHMLLDIQLDQILHYADNLAGYDAGIHEKNGKAFLSLRSPETPEPHPGDWSTLLQVFTGLFVNEQNLKRFMAWFYYAWLYLHEREWAPLPVLALAGPRNCGKTLIVEILARVLGNTEKGAALRYISNETSFNADLAGSHLLVVDDEISSMDMRARRSTGQRIKALAVTNDHRIEPKGFDAITLSPHWRCIFATNDEPEALQVLPPIDDGMKDKLLLLRCRRVDMPMPAKTPKQRRDFMTKLMEEVPAMLHTLGDARWIDDYADVNRMAVVGWQDELLLESLHSLDAHRQLLDLVDVLNPYSVVLGGWEGTAAELESLLKSDPSTNRTAERVLNWPNACGTYLGRLAQEPKSRVERAKPERDRKWFIKANDNN
jgi:hypothetical protein